MSNANLERRVERNTNDIEAIYDLLTDHGEQLADHGRQLADHGRQLAEIQVKLTEHDARFDHIDETLTVVLDRLPPTSAD